MSLIFHIEKSDNKTSFYACNHKLFTIKHKSKYRKIYEKRFKGLTEAEQRYILEQQFIRNTGYPLNLDNPQTFNEKIQWLKLYDHNPLMTICADKVAVRDYIKEKIGEEYLVPALGIYDKPEDIDFNKLPNRFVLKVNWGSGQNIIVKDKSTLDIEAAKTQLAEWMKPENNHYYDFLEWAYKDIKPKIIAEKYIEQIDGKLLDYKFFCFNGKALYMQIDVDRQTNHMRSIYDMNFEKQNFSIKYPIYSETIKKPKYFDKMKQLSELFAHDFSLLRVDWYEINNQLKVGELTFYSEGGQGCFEPKEWDYKLGELIELPITEK